MLSFFMDWWRRALARRLAGAVHWLGRLFARHSLWHLDASHRPDHEVEERPRDHDQREVSDDRTDGACAHGAKGGSDDQEGRDDDLKEWGPVAVHLRAHRVGDDHGDRDRGRDDRSRSDDQRPLVRLQGLELLARRAVSLLIALGDALAPLDAPLLALAPLRSLSLPVRHQLTASRARAPLSAPAAASGSRASRMALTTTIRPAPAVTTSRTFSVSIPPIANHGIVAARAA